MERYVRGEKITRADALVKLANDEVVWYVHNPLKLCQHGLLTLIDDRWTPSAKELCDCFYEAIPALMYDLNFIQAYEATKNGRAVKLKDSDYVYRYSQSDRRWYSCDPVITPVQVCDAIIYGRYRIVENS